MTLLVMPRPVGGKTPAFRWLALLFVAVLVVLAAGYAWDRHNASRMSEIDPAQVVPAFGPRNAADALAQIEDGVQQARGSVERSPDEWLRKEQLGRTLVARFGLTGSYSDLAEARKIYAAGIAEAPYPSGPVMAAINLALTEHRLNDAEGLLDRADDFAIPTENDRADVLVYRSDIAAQRGDPAAALKLLDQADAIAPDDSISMRRAALLFQTGHLAEGIAMIERLFKAGGQKPQTLSRLALQRAAFAYAQGDWADAGRWIAAADKFFPGSWLVEAHKAQQAALEGRTDEAIAAYTIVANSSRVPEVMDALAALLRAEGRGAESRQWADRSAAIWQQRLALSPTAAAQHAAEHELALGDASRALAIASADVRARPHGASIAIYARALVLSGRPAEALHWLDRAKEQGWVSAGLLMQRSEVAAALGDDSASKAAHKVAEAINPRAADPRSRLIWFGHD